MPEYDGRVILLGYIVLGHILHHLTSSIKSQVLNEIRKPSDRCFTMQNSSCPQYYCDSRETSPKLFTHSPRSLCLTAHP